MVRSVCLSGLCLAEGSGHLFWFGRVLCPYVCPSSTLLKKFKEHLSQRDRLLSVLPLGANILWCARPIQFLAFMPKFCLRADDMLPRHRQDTVPEPFLARVGLCCPHTWEMDFAGDLGSLARNSIFDPAQQIMY